jgi:N-acetylmuramoyl-L-alanine amidase
VDVAATNFHKSINTCGALLGNVMRKLLSTFGFLFLLGVLAGCATTAPSKYEKINAQSQDSRVQFLILHFTAENLERSLRYLTTGPVSSHYLVTDEAKPRVLQLVDERNRAWHAGASSWGLNGGLNASSIGIEIVNQVGPAGPNGITFTPYPEAQIDAVLALCKEIVTRHGIKPEHVLGHSDIAPQRKEDPGPLFPWKRFAEAGLILWPDTQRVRDRIGAYETALPTVAWFQQKLGAFGYGVPRSGVLDKETQRVIGAFQMRYRPTRYDGMPDAETAAMLDALLAAKS